MHPAAPNQQHTSLPTVWYALKTTKNKSQLKTSKVSKNKGNSNCTQYTVSMFQ